MVNLGVTEGLKDEVTYMKTPEAWVYLRCGEMVIEEIFLGQMLFKEWQQVSVGGKKAREEAEEKGRYPIMKDQTW